MDIRIQAPSPCMIEKEVQRIHDEFRNYYYRRQRSIHRYICTANNGFLLQSGALWKIVDQVYDPLRYKVLNEMNIREFFMYHIQNLLKHSNEMLKVLQASYSLYNQYKETTKSNRSTNAKKKMLKRRYESNLREWNNTNLNYFTVRTMLPSINIHIKQEIKWSKDFLMKLRKKTKRALNEHRTRMKIVFEEMSLAWDAIKISKMRF